MKLRKRLSFSGAVGKNPFGEGMTTSDDVKPAAKVVHSGTLHARKPTACACNVYTLIGRTGTTRARVAAERFGVASRLL